MKKIDTRCRTKQQQHWTVPDGLYLLLLLWISQILDRFYSINKIAWLN